MAIPNYTSDSATTYKTNIDETIDNTLIPNTMNYGSPVDQYTATLGLSALEAGRLYVLKVGNANTTTTPTLNIDSIGAYTITHVGGGALAIDELRANQFALFVFDTSTSPNTFVYVTPLLGDVVIDSNGNVGLGVTPESGWDTTTRNVLRIGQASAFIGRANADTTEWASNAKYNGSNWVYINNGTASIIQSNVSGKILFYTATSGTAGNTITWTTALTINNDGSISTGTNPTSGYVSGVWQEIEADVGADSTAFDIDAAIAAAWESVGPTGSGATNIWTALDNVPSGVKWVRLKIYNSATVSGTGVYQQIYARKTGSSTGIGTQTIASINKVTATGSGATIVTGENMSVVDVPVDSSIRFDLYRDASGTTFTCAAHLVGWGA